MRSCLLEVCVDSVESALAAANGGADRLELCANLVIGGTTADAALFREVRRHTAIPIHALIRPRFGDFCYSEYEFHIMLDEVRQFAALGAEGIVIGILNPDGALDCARMELLIDAAGKMSVTLHRAFDVCRDPFAAMEDAIALGADTILTSGQKNTALDGLPLLRELNARACGRINIMAGAGICAEAIQPLAEQAVLRVFHMSGKIVEDSAMTYRKADVSMGLPAFSEYELWRTDEAAVRSARRVLDEIQQGIFEIK